MDPQALDPVDIDDKCVNPHKAVKIWPRPQNHFTCPPPHRAGNEPSYSGSARKKLGSGSARELNEPSLSHNLGLINLGLGSGLDRKSSARATGTHPSLERGFRLRSPAGRIWSSLVRSRLKRAGVKFPGHVSRISM